MGKIISFIIVLTFLFSNVSYSSNLRPALMTERGKEGQRLRIVAADYAVREEEYDKALNLAMEAMFAGEIVDNLETVIDVFEALVAHYDPESAQGKMSQIALEMVTLHQNGTQMTAERRLDLYKKALAALWDFTKIRGFEDLNPPYDRDKRRWKRIYGISSIFRVEAKLIKKIQEALREKLPSDILDKIEWLEPETGHITIVGFKLKHDELDEATIDKQRNTSDRILGEELRSQVDFHATGISMMPDGTLFIPMIPDDQGFVTLDGVYGRHLREAPKEIIGNPTYIAHASLGYLCEGLSEGEKRILIEVIEGLSEEDFGLVSAGEVELYSFSNLSFLEGSTLNRYSL